MMVPIPIINANDNAIALFSIFPPNLCHCFLHDLFDRCYPFSQFAKAGSAQRYHAQVDRLPSKFDRACADDYQFTQLVRYLHNFIKSDAALVAGVETCLATASAIDLESLGFFEVETDLNQPFYRHMRLIFTVVADAPDETLCLNKVDTRGHEERLDTHVQEPRNG